MTGYIYSILKSLSDFDFTVSEYASDGGVKVTTSALQRYCRYVDCTSLKDFEVNEICRLLKLRYQRKFKDLLFSQIQLIMAGEQEFSFDLDGSIHSIWINLQADRLSISLGKNKTCEIDALKGPFLNNTSIGPSASSAAKEALAESLSQLVLKTI